MRMHLSAYLEIVFGALLVVLGLWVVKSSIDLGYMNHSNPGAGFFPFWIGCLLTVSAALLVWSAFGGREAETELPIAGPMLAMLCCGLYVLACWLAGVTLASFAYLFLIFRFHAGIRLRTSFIGALSSTTILYVLFVIWLEVPLPAGLLGLV